MLRALPVSGRSLCGVGGGWGVGGPLGKETTCCADTPNSRGQTVA